jgi:hypothetical protein
MTPLVHRERMSRIFIIHSIYNIRVTSLIAPFLCHVI